MPRFAILSLLAVPLLGLAPPAAAQELRDLCTTRPSLGTSACIVDKGHAVVEFGALDWTREKDADERTDTVLAGDALVRFGLTQSSEVQLGWMAFGHVRTRDRATGQVERISGIGDVSIAFRQNLRNPDSSGTSYGIQPFVTLPTGRNQIGAGDWGAGVIAPISFELSDALKLVFDPEVDAAVDEDGNGRHLRYGNVLGLEVALGKAVSTTLELSSFHDRDPERHATVLQAALSFAWQLTDDLQVDAAGVAGLNRESPDVRLLTGLSARF